MLSSIYVFTNRLFYLFLFVKQRSKHMQLYMHKANALKCEIMLTHLFGSLKLNKLTYNCIN